LLDQLEAQAAQPDFWDNQTAARTILDKSNQHKRVLKPFDEVSQMIDDAVVMSELAEIEEDPATRAEAVAETARLIRVAEKGFDRLETNSLLNGPMDGSNAYLSIHAGAGGTESCDWASMLHRMYLHYCEDAGFEVETVDINDGEEAGIVSVTFGVRGPNAYGYLKAERGVHRLVRISPFDSNKRRHTSFASLDVIAEIDEDIEVDIREEDLEVDTFRASGAGGQHVNKTDSAIRIRHIPTGIVVSCQAERSQHKNRSKAMSVLKARIYELELDKQRKSMEKFYGEKGSIAWGSQIRSYVLQPYTMVKDLRTGLQTGNVQAVLDGELQMFIDGWLKWKAGKLKADVSTEDLS